jgi:hypothetical protein
MERPGTFPDPQRELVIELVATIRSVLMGSVVVEPLRVVDQRPRKVVLHRLIDCVEIG